MKYFSALLLLIGFNFFIIKNSIAQDIHYSQFYNAPLNINPANTGIFNGDQRFMASVRDQGRNVPIPWFTFSGSYDRKIYPKRSETHFWSWGLTFNYDRQGLANLALSNFNLLGSYTRVLNERNLLTFGLGVGIANRGLDQDNLTWDKQWDGNQFVSSLQSGEANIESINFVENMVGVNYRWQKTKRTKLDFGIGVYHAIEPKVEFFNSDDAILPRRIAASVVGNFELVKAFDIQLNGIAQFQGDYREYQVGGLGKIYVNSKRGKEFELHLGVGYRFSKSMFPIIAIQAKNLYASFSYDLEISEKNKGRGGPELHFNYIITKVKPLKKFKVCPIF